MLKSLRPARLYNVSEHLCASVCAGDASKTCGGSELISVGLDDMKLIFVAAKLIA